MIIRIISSQNIINFICNYDTTIAIRYVWVSAEKIRVDAHVICFICYLSYEPIQLTFLVKSDHIQWRVIFHCFRHHLMNFGQPSQKVFQSQSIQSIYFLLIFDIRDVERSWLTVQDYLECFVPHLNDRVNDQQMLKLNRRLFIHTDFESVFQQLFCLCIISISQRKRYFFRKCSTNFLKSCNSIPIQQRYQLRVIITNQQRTFSRKQKIRQSGFCLLIMQINQWIVVWYDFDILI